MMKFIFYNEPLLTILSRYKLSSASCKLGVILDGFELKLNSPYSFYGWS